MKIELTTTALKTIVISHGNDSIEMTNRSFSKQTVPEPFKEINEFWAQKPEEEQQKIFNIYYKFAKFYENLVDGSHALETIREMASKLNEFHVWEEIDEFRKSLNLSIPERVSNPDLNVYSQQTTYSKEEYENLQSLSLALRPYFPMVAATSDICKSQFTKNQHDNQVYGILKLTDAAQSDAVVRLSNYMENLPKFSKAKVPTGTLVGGQGTATLKTQLVNRILLKKVLVASLSTVDNLISNIYKYAENILNSFERGDGKILDKKQKGSGDDDERSVADLYKLPVRVNDGISVAINEAMKNESHVVKSLPDPVTLTEFRLFKSNLKRVMSDSAFVIHPYHPRLCALVLGDLAHGCCPPRGFENLEMEPMINAIAATQAQLWKWGLKHLSTVMSAVVDSNVDIGMFGGGVSKTRTNQQMIDDLLTIFPNSKPKPNTTERLGSEGHTTIDEMSKLFTGKNWITKMPKEYCDLVPKYLESIPDLRTNLGQIILECHRFNELKDKECEVK